METEASRVQKLLIAQDKEIIYLKQRIEQLEAALLKIHEYPMAFDARQILLKALGEKKDD